MFLGKIIQCVSVIWIFVTVGGVVASGPIAWRVLVGGGGEAGESKVLAWVAIMVILCLPAGISLAYVRYASRKDREVTVCI